jgi:hypothetical protein
MIILVLLVVLVVLYKYRHVVEIPGVSAPASPGLSMRS